MFRVIASLAPTRRTWSSAFAVMPFATSKASSPPSSSLIGTAAELGRQDPGFFEDDRALAYLFRILQHSETVLNVYVGLDGRLVPSGAPHP